MTNRKQKLAVIHIAKKQCGLDEQSYRSLLFGAAGVDSASQIKTESEYRKILHAFNSLGFRYNDHKIKDRQLAKCYAIWTDLYDRGAVSDRRYSAMESWIKRQLKTDQDILNVHQKGRLIEDLKAWLKRVEGNDDGKRSGDG